MAQHKWRVPRKLKKQMKTELKHGYSETFVKLMSKFVFGNYEHKQEIRKSPLFPSGGVVAHADCGTGEVVINHKEVERLRQQLSFKPSVEFHIEAGAFEDGMQRVRDGLKGIHIFTE